MNEAIREATRIQADAADPRSSVVLRASAGSGKTRVLIDRFVRLCLEGCPAKAILAITFTRKAAVEIKKRLMSRAVGYATMEEDALRSSLAKLLGAEPDPRQIDLAGRLYEEILQDSAGLNVGTIHQFCQVVLNRFAAEAGLDPRFGILEKEDELHDEALEALEAEVARDEGAGRAFLLLSGRPTGARMKLRGLLKGRTHLERWLERVRAAVDMPEDGAEDFLSRPRLPLLSLLLAELRAGMFLDTCLAGNESPDETLLATPLADALEDFAGAGLAAVEAAETDGLTPGFVKKRDEMKAAVRCAADRLRHVETGADCAEEFGGIRGIFLTGAGNLRKLSGKNTTTDARLAALAAAARPSLELLALVGVIQLYRHNEAMLRFGLRLLDIYTELKLRERCIDFQDLELIAWRLMRDPDKGLYIQYRLDESLRHLLVDEFQDTNFNQWEILEPFVDEFLAGDPDRTIFFVGDVKQSIYRFRGAEPGLFGKAAGRLVNRPHSQILGLPTNFRSVPEVVGSVGDLFSVEPLVGMLSPEDRMSVLQLCARESDHGSVTIIPPFTETEVRTADQEAARATAGLVAKMAEGGCRYGDMLILCRNRTRIATYEQALRDANIPFLPAGRGQLAASREVQDVLTLLRWLCFPHDDVALASVLRSPFFRVSEERMQAVLGVRTRSKAALWTIMETEEGAAGVNLGVEAAMLRGWLKRVGSDTCHEILRRIYRESDAPERFAAALGRQARFNLLRLHDLALGSELGARPTLRSLVEVIQRAARTDSEDEAVMPGQQGQGRVGLMTVHGAKGLQRKVVLIVDADAPVRETISSLSLRPGTSDGPKIFGLTRSHLAGPRAADDSEIVTPGFAPAAEAARIDAQREEANILYVAMTRAKDHLFILGGEHERRNGRTSLLDWLLAAADRAPAGRFQLGAPGWLSEWMQETDTATASTAETSAESEPTDRHVWKPPRILPVIRSVSPSKLAGADAGNRVGVDADTALSETRRQALAYGTEVHLWLQRAAEKGAMPSGGGEARREAEAVFLNPDFDWIFRPQGGTTARCEVRVLHRRAVDAEGEERIDGSIDRLVIGPQRVDIIDYKTNRIDVGDVAALDAASGHYHPQLECYRDAAREIWPGREIHTWLLFTHSAPGVLVEV